MFLVCKTEWCKDSVLWTAVPCNWKEGTRVRDALHIRELYRHTVGPVWQTPDSEYHRTRLDILVKIIDIVFNTINLRGAFEFYFIHCHSEIYICIYTHNISTITSHVHYILWCNARSRVIGSRNFPCAIGGELKGQSWHCVILRSR